MISHLNQVTQLRRLSLDLTTLECGIKTPRIGTSYSIEHLQNTRSARHSLQLRLCFAPCHLLWAQDLAQCLAQSNTIKVAQDFTRGRKRTWLSLEWLSQRAIRKKSLWAASMGDRAGRGTGIGTATVRREGVQQRHRDPGSGWAQQSPGDHSRPELARVCGLYPVSLKGNQTVHWKD